MGESSEQWAITCILSSISFHIILFYSILFYSILFYFILFKFELIRRRLTCWCKTDQCGGV